jgi:hypothetical protein
MRPELRDRSPLAVANRLAFPIALAAALAARARAQDGALVLDASRLDRVAGVLRRLQDRYLRRVR